MLWFSRRPACGSCADVCPRGAISVQHGCFAQVDVMRCVGCGLCARECPLEWTITAPGSPWVVQFSFKLYSLMLTSEIIAILAMIWFRPRHSVPFVPWGHCPRGFVRFGTGRDSL